MRRKGDVAIGEVNLIMIRLTERTNVFERLQLLYTYCPRNDYV